MPLLLLVALWAEKPSLVTALLGLLCTESKTPVMSRSLGGNWVGVGNERLVPWQGIPSVARCQAAL